VRDDSRWFSQRETADGKASNKMVLKWVWRSAQQTGVRQGSEAERIADVPE
jgi:hypothetical protein